MRKGVLSVFILVLVCLPLLVGAAEKRTTVLLTLVSAWGRRFQTFILTRNGGRIPIYRGRAECFR